MSHPLSYWGGGIVLRTKFAKPSTKLVFHKDEPSATIRQFFEFSEPSTSLLQKEKKLFQDMDHSTSATSCPGLLREKPWERG